MYVFSIQEVLIPYLVCFVSVIVKDCPSCATVVQVGVVVDTILSAEHDAVVPPFTEEHDQFHGPEPVTEEGVPSVQRLVEGAVRKD